MHVILQGARSVTLFYTIIIEHSIGNGFFSLQDLNDFILNFSYGYAEVRGKPVLKSQEDLKEPGANLGETAAQMWLLSRIFPFFAHQFSHDYPDVWRTLMTMLEIAGIC